MTAWLASVALGLFAALAAVAAGSNDLSNAEIQGRQLTQELLDQRPTENFTNTGVLQIRDGNGKTVEVPIGFRITVTETNWQSVYNIHKIVGTNENRSGWTSLVVTHKGSNPNQYKFYELFNEIKFDPVVTNLTSDQTMVPFADSDFWIADLGLEFFHWPEQKILKPYEMRRGRSCKVLESINPYPSPNGYSRVVSWIDNETLGIVQAGAYDAKGKLQKEFYPKDFKKVKGQWQMGEMEMMNDQTGSRTWIKFDLKRHD